MPVLATNELTSMELLRQRPRVELSARDRQMLRGRLKLSPREIEIIQLFMHSLRETEIAVELRISTHTVHTHVGRLYRRLNVASAAELMIRIMSLSRTVELLR